MTPRVTVLIPTCERPAALAVTLAGLSAQRCDDFAVVISDQSEAGEPLQAGEVQTMLRILRLRGHRVETHRHLPRRGIAEQRQFLLERATTRYVLYLDDDVFLEPWVLGNLLRLMARERCGFVGSAFIGASFVGDERPHEEVLELWEGRVLPEEVLPDTPAWERWRLHNAANLYHVQRRLGCTPDAPRAYKVAWVPGCVLFDTAKLRTVGGFDFWRELPPDHCGEDVLVQLRVMQRFGGCGMLPSGAYHQEVPTTIPRREVAADRALGWGRRRGGA